MIFYLFRRRLQLLEVLLVVMGCCCFHRSLAALVVVVMGCYLHGSVAALVVMDFGPHLFLQSLLLWRLIFF